MALFLTPTVGGGEHEEDSDMDRSERFPQRRAAAAVDVHTRALAMWPGLDRRKLARASGDPARIARLIERRTALPRESIIGILEGRS